MNVGLGFAVISFLGYRLKLKSDHAFLLFQKYGFYATLYTNILVGGGRILHGLHGAGAVEDVGDCGEVRIHDPAN